MIGTKNDTDQTRFINSLYIFPKIFFNKLVYLLIDLLLYAEKTTF